MTTSLSLFIQLFPVYLPISASRDEAIYFFKGKGGREGGGICIEHDYSLYNYLRQIRFPSSLLPDD